MGKFVYITGSLILLSTILAGCANDPSEQRYQTRYQDQQYQNQPYQDQQYNAYPPQPVYQQAPPQYAQPPQQSGGVGWGHVGAFGAGMAANHLMNRNNNQQQMQTPRQRPVVINRYVTRPSYSRPSYSSRPSRSSSRSFSRRR